VNWFKRIQLAFSPRASRELRALAHPPKVTTEPQLRAKYREEFREAQGAIFFPRYSSEDEYVRANIGDDMPRGL
jgi:hypothetical protein